MAEFIRVVVAKRRTGSPNSDGVTLQVDWLPFNKNGGPEIWPMSNLKLSLQYTDYLQFDGAAHNYDGSGRDAGSVPIKRACTPVEVRVDAYLNGAFSESFPGPGEKSTC